MNLENIKSNSNKECLLKKIMADKVKTKDILFPGTAHKITLHILSCADDLEASIAADKHYRTAGIPVGVENIDQYQAEKTTQLLYRATREPGTDTPLTPDINSFRELLSISERVVLSEEVFDFKEEVDPTTTNFTDEELHNCAATILKNIDVVRTITSNQKLRSLVVYFANQYLKAKSKSNDNC